MGHVRGTGPYPFLGVAVPTLRELWGKYQEIHFRHLAHKTRQEYRTAMERHALRALPPRPSAADVERWLRVELAGRYEARYANATLQVLKTVVRVASCVMPDAEVSAAVLTCRKLKEPPPRPRCPPEDFHPRALEATRTPAERAWLRLAGEGGLRMGELMGLLPDAIDFRTGVVHVVRQRRVEHRKNRRPHAVEIDAELLADLRWTIANRDLVRPTGGYWRGDARPFVFPWAKRWLESFLERIREHFGADRDRYLPEKRGWHAWRAWGATQRARAGYTELEICEWLGDADTKMAARYVAFVRGATRATSKVLPVDRKPCHKVERPSPTRRGVESAQSMLCATISGLELVWQTENGVSHVNGSPQGGSVGVR